MTCVRRFALTLAALAAMASPAFAQAGSFGNSVIIDGDALLIGEPNNSFRPGMVYVYGKTGSEWAETTILTAPDAERADGLSQTTRSLSQTAAVPCSHTSEAERAGRLTRW